MPFLDEVQGPTVPQSVLDPSGQTPIPAQADAPVQNNGPVLGAAFRQSNWIGSAVASRTFGVDNSAEGGYNAWNDIKGSKYEPYWSSFAEANNPRYAAALKTQIDMEEDDRRALAASGWAGTLLSMGAGLADPLNLLPGSVLVSGAKGSYSIGKSALATGTALAAGVALQEGALHASQELRTGEESAVNIGSGFLMGALLGGAAAGFMGRAEQKAFERGYDTLHNVAQGGAGGADVTRAATAEELSISGGYLTHAFADKTSALSPVLRARQRPVPAAMETMQKLAEDTLYSKANDVGLANAAGGAAESEYKVLVNSRMASAIKEHDDIYAQAVKEGFSGGKPAFEEAVGMAMRNGDQAIDGNTYVGRAAQVWRAKVFDPFKEEAIQLGLLPKDVQVEEAASYFSRVYNREKLIAQEFDFKNLIQPHIEQKIAADYASHAENTTARISKLDRDIRDLQLSAGERTATMADLRRQGAALDAANADHIDTLDKVAELRAQMKDADPLTKDALRRQIADLRSEGGEGLKAYEQQRSDLRRRMRHVDLGVAGVQSRADRIAQQLTDLEEGVRGRMERLVKKGQQFEKDAARVSPDVLAERVSNLRDQFAALAKREDASVERLQKLLEPKEGVEGWMSTALKEKIEGQIKTQQARRAKLSAIAERLEAAEGLDGEALLGELRNGVEALKAQITDKALAAGERAASLKERMAKLDPQRVADQIAAKEALKKEIENGFYDRWETRVGGQGVGGKSPNFSDAARQVVDDIFDKISGRSRVGDTSFLPEYMVPITRGPMKDRTLHIPDRVIQDYLVSNIREVGERYARQMAGDVALTRKFGRADMRDQIKTIKDQYAGLREAVANAATPKEIEDLIGRSNSGLDGLRAWMRDIDAKTVNKERALKYLDADMHGAIEDVEAIRDMMRGMYKVKDSSSGLAATVRTMNAFNYIRLSGSFFFSSLTDLYHAAFTNGMRHFVEGNVAPLLHGLEGVKLSVQEAKLAGLVAERTLHHRMSSLAELGDPFARGTAIERFMKNGANLATKWNGLALLQDVAESIASVNTQNRILEGLLKGKDEKFLSYLQLGPAEREAIADMYRVHGYQKDGVHVANTQAWMDTARGANAARSYRNAVQKYVTTSVVKPGMGDLPLFMHTPLGKALTQFRSFSVAAHTRTTLRGMQEGPGQVLSFMVGTIPVGALISYLSALRGGNERLQKWMQQAQNPGFIIGEALDRAGFMPLMFEAANTSEKLLQTATGHKGLNPLKAPFEKAFPNAPQELESGRTLGRDALSMIAGPSVGLMTDVARAAGAGIATFSGENPNKMQKRALQGLTPYGSMPAMKEMLQLLYGDSPYTR